MHEPWHMCACVRASLKMGTIMFAYDRMHTTDGPNLTPMLNLVSHLPYVSGVGYGVTIPQTCCQ